VDIPTLIRVTIPRAAKCRKYKFRVLYQQAGIISCLFSFALPQTENWLLIIKPQEHRILETFRLESTARIFVRNNERFLYFGTHSGEGADGLRKWVIKGFDIHNLVWLPQPRMHLPNVAGCDIGSTVCFEIFNGYFYGLSSQTLFEVDDPNWTSHYYCFRFPLNEPCHEKTQVMTKEDSWRRQHYEGPIDDRWGFLSLEADETTGNVVILECRKEWLRDHSGSQRTYYTTEVFFRQQAGQEDQQRVRAGTMRRLDDHPHCDGPIPTRSPRYVHAGDDSSMTSLLVRSKTHFCAYIRCCQTFIDLIDDTYMDTSGMQRLRLRTGHRRLKPGTGQVSRTPVSNTPWKSSEASKNSTIQPYQTNEIFIWPPTQDPSQPDPSLDRVQQLLNVDGYQGCVTATGDERSVVYATSDGSKGGVQALVFISFDPAAMFEDMERGRNILGQRIPHEGEGLVADDRPISSGMLQFSPEVPMGPMGAMKCSNASEAIRPPSSNAALASSGDDSYPPLLPTTPEGVESWASYGRPMHSEIRQKLYFGR
jgi:hypothetical protein